MKAGILGRKLGMTQIVTESGRIQPVTVIEAGPCKVVQKKTVEKDGYNALQLGLLEKRVQLVSKPLKEHFAKAQVKPQRYLREIRLDDIGSYELGQTLSVDMFNEGDYVDITGVSKGKGTAGVMKRWGFRGGKASHGAEKIHRKPGSIGCSADPARVFKGKKMAGRLGNKRVTVQNMQVAGVRKDDNVILVKGSVPGWKTGLLLINKAVKKG